MDIIILKKSSQKSNRDISSYFEKNTENILGEIREKSNRFGRMELYVHGNLDEALARLQRLETNKQAERIGNLFEDLLFENGETEVNIKKTVPVEKEGNPEKETEIDLSEVQDKLKTVVSQLNDIKFKSPSIVKEIDKYINLQTQLTDERKNFSQDQFAEILAKTDKIVQAQNKSKESEYSVQTKPQIKKGILKYLFSKTDEVVNTSLQNSSDITPQQFEAFRDTDYDGTLNNRGKHYRFANYIDGNWVHDFYYAEDNIYAKLEQLERDFADKNSVGGTEDQYEKQKALLQRVLPIPKSIDEYRSVPITNSSTNLHRDKWKKNDTTTIQN